MNMNMNKMKHEAKFIGVTFALLALAVLAACSPQNQQSTEGGRAVFVMTDDAANMGSVTAITITIESVRVLSASGAWTEVSSKRQTYDLLTLKAQGIQVLLADYNLTPGVYHQVRLNVSKVVVTDASGDHVAKLPSNELKIIRKITVNRNSTSTIKFDFIAHRSLHLTGEGTYIFAPVIHFETREKANVEFKRWENANRDHDSDGWDIRGHVEIRDGKVDEDAEEGMDIDGNFGEGHNIGMDSRLFVRGDGIFEESGGMDDSDRKEG